MPNDAGALRRLVSTVAAILPGRRCCVHISEGQLAQQFHDGTADRNKQPEVGMRKMSAF